MNCVLYLYLQGNPKPPAGLHPNPECKDELQPALVPKSDTSKSYKQTQLCVTLKLQLRKILHGLL